MITQGLINLLGSAPALTNPPASLAQVSGQAAIADLVGIAAAGTGARVYLLGAVPEGTAAPYLVVEQLTGDSVQGFAGQTGTESGLVRVHCFAATPTAAQQLAQLVGELLDCYRGPAGQLAAAGSASPGQVDGIFQEDAQQQFAPPVHGDEAGNPVVVRDFQIWQSGSF